LNKNAAIGGSTSHFFSKFDFKFDFFYSLLFSKKRTFFRSFSIQSFYFLFFDEQILRKETIDEREIDQRETDRNDMVDNKIV